MVKIVEIIVESKQIITKPHKLKRLLDRGALLTVRTDSEYIKHYLVRSSYEFTNAWLESHSESDMNIKPTAVDYKLAMSFVKNKKDYVNMNSWISDQFWYILSKKWKQSVKERDLNEAKNWKSQRRMKRKDRSDKRAAQQADKKKENVWLTDPIVKAWPEFHRSRPSESSVSSQKIAKFIRFKIHHYITSKNIKAGFGGGDHLLNSGVWQGHRFSKVLIGGHKGSNFSMIYKWDKGILYLVSFIKHQQSDTAGAFMNYANKILNAEESQKAASKLFTL